MIQSIAQAIFPILPGDCKKKQSDKRNLQASWIKRTNFLISQLTLNQFLYEH